MRILLVFASALAIIVVAVWAPWEANEAPVTEVPVRSLAERFATELDGVMTECPDDLEGACYVDRVSSYDNGRGLFDLLIGSFEDLAPTGAWRRRGHTYTRRFRGDWGQEFRVTLSADPAVRGTQEMLVLVSEE